MHVQPFTLDVLSTHRVFFLLKHLPKGATSVDVQIQTPRGLEDIDFVDVFSMADGSLLASWEHPSQKLGLQNLIATVGEKSQLINLYPVERIIDVYDKPVDSEFGVFVFANSTSIESGDWRCDRGYYGAIRFVEDTPTPFVMSLDDIIMYEPFLSVGGAGHILYMEIQKNSETASERLNNALIPTIGRTFQEVLRLVYEWSVLANEPFNGDTGAAIPAKNYIDVLNLSEEELVEIENLTPMQVAQFLTGSEYARVRPTNIQPMNDGIRNILFDRMAASSLSFIVARNPGIWELEPVLQKEREELEEGIQRFRTYYSVPLHTEIHEIDKIVEMSDVFVRNQKAYVHNQLRLFNNKKLVLDNVLNFS